MRVIGIITSLFICAFIVRPVFAATVSVSNIPSTIDRNQEVEVSVSVLNAANSTQNYLRAVVASTDTPTSYSGFTYNNSSWYNGSPSPIDPKQFLKIDIDPQGSWSGKLKFKLDPADSSFKGSGNYLVKVGRYTANGSTVTDWSDPVQVTVNAPSSTPSPQPTSTPTRTPTPSPAPTATPIVKVSPTETEEVDSSAEGAVLGDSTYDSSSNNVDDTETPTQTPTPLVEGNSRNNTITNFFIIIGFLLLSSVCGILLWRGFRKQKEMEL